MTASLSNGFVKHFVHKGAENGHLRGLTFAVKDMYDVYGHVNACGNPSWLATHPDAATSNAPSVQALLDAGTQLSVLLQLAVFTWSALLPSTRSFKQYPTCHVSCPPSHRALISQ
jgi:hypothetical protein